MQLIARNPNLLREHFQLLWDYVTVRLQLNHLIREASKRPTQKKVVILTFTQTALWSKFHGLISLILRLRGYYPTIVLMRPRGWGYRFLRACGLDRRIGEIIFWEDLLLKYSPDSEWLDQQVLTLFPRVMSLQQIKNLFYRNIAVGRQALSQASRNLNLGRMDFNDPKIFQAFLIQLKSAIQSVVVTERWLSENPVNMMIVRDAGYLPNAAIYEVACLGGVDTIRSEFGQKLHTWIFKRQTPQERWSRHISISGRTWNQIKDTALTPDQEAALAEEFMNRYRPDSQADLRRIQAGKFDKSQDEVREILGLDPNKKTAVVFSHVPFDAAFFYGEDLFEDFEEWFIETTRIACANPHLNWVLKLHPANVIKMVYSGMTEETELRGLQKLGPLPPHIRVMRSNTPINTRSLLQVTDFGLTVRGSVGFELPCLGIPCLTAGTGAYSAFGFTIDSNSREEYFERLRNLHHHPALSDEQIALARRHAYHLLLRRQTSLESLAKQTASAVHESKWRKFSFWNLHFQLKKKSLHDIEVDPFVSKFLTWATSSVDPDFMP